MLKSLAIYNAENVDMGQYRGDLAVKNRDYT